MQKEILPYLGNLKNKVTKRISSILNKRTISNIAQIAFSNYFGSTNPSAFYKYYFDTVSNRDLFLSSPNFFRQFKQQYSLQGIDGSYLDRLEENKLKILNLIENHDLIVLYSEFFENVQIKHGNTTKEKSLGSFFAKFVHTFIPDKYCALDNPIKNLLGLEKESFYISFFVISEAYKDWAIENPEIMKKIKTEAQKHSPHEMTDLKLIDLLLWYEANKR